MQINIKGHHVEVTDSMQDYVNNKFHKLERFNKYFDKINISLKLEKNDHIAEATLNINQNKMHISVTDANMYAAIDLLLDKTVRQLNKYKEKHF